LLQEKIAIGEDETAGELHDRMKDIGSEIILKTVKGLRDGTLVAASQLRSDRDGQTGLKTAPKIFTDNCKIDWNKNVDEVYNLIRGLSPHPTAFTFLNIKTLKIYKADKEIIKPLAAPGNFDTDKKTFLKFACTGGYINITELQLEGKKRMSVTEFLRGYHF
jgi:methionyl-tRNA formyltransferase